MGIGNRILIKIVKGRIRHKCDMCTAPILPDEHYNRAHCQKDGTFITREYCITHPWKLINADMREARAKAEMKEDVELWDDTDAWHDQERRNEDQKAEDWRNNENSDN